MPAEKQSSNKNYLIALAVVLLVVVAGLIFLSRGNSQEENGAANANINEKYGIKKLQINKIDIKFFSDKSFQDLEEKVGAIGDKEPATGKANPFKKNQE